MTIAALLKQFGMTTPRWITVDGQTVFNGVTATASGYVHSTHGLVTAVAPHTFHGGEEEPDDVPDTVEYWWDDEDELARHNDAMQQSFPSFSFLPPEDGMGPVWGGVIDTGRGRFDVGIFPRADRGLPRVVVFKRRLGVMSGRHWVPSPHLYLNGNLCVADQSDWNPDKHTAATITCWAAHWLAAYTEWRITRRWPVEGYAA